MLILMSYTKKVNKMKPLVALDIECVPNYFLIAMKGVESGKLVTFEAFGDKASLSKDDIQRIKTILKTKTTFGFNSNKYDIPMIAYALTGARTDQLHKVSADIIDKNKPEWMTMRDLDIEYPIMDHFDICEPAPAVMISLKNYGTRIGSKKLMEFFVNPHEPIDEEQRKVMRDIYCTNDLDITIDLYQSIADRIDLRIKMSEEYGMDLRSKSDAQIAETVISSELSKLGIEACRPELSSGYKARYIAPDYIQFQSKHLKELLTTIEEVEFRLADNGQVKMPTQLANMKIVIGNTTYKLGIGGLHSQEKKLAVTSNATHTMRNADFSSYYPAIILENHLFPKHLSRKFLDIYGKIREQRLYAKKKVEELKKELQDVSSKR